MLTTWPMLDRAAAWPIAVMPAPHLTDSDLRAAQLDDFDTAIATLDRALSMQNEAYAALNEANRFGRLAECRLEIARAALA